MLYGVEPETWVGCSAHGGLKRKSRSRLTDKMFSYYLFPIPELGRHELGLAVISELC